MLKEKTYYITTKKYFKYILILIFLTVIILIFMSTNYNIEADTNIDQSVAINNNSDNEKKLEKSPVYIYVDIKGAIKNPGVYKLEQGNRVNDAILKSGGLLKKANTRYINLSKILEDEMVIIVYTDDEIKKMKENNTVIKYIEKECKCPEISNDACIEKDNSPEQKSINKISLNSATIEELETLPGIGNSKAIEIVNYRENNGGFKSLEELMEISGIGSATFEKLKDLVTI